MSEEEPRAASKAAPPTAVRPCRAMVTRMAGIAAITAACFLLLAPDRLDLHTYERRVFSQHGEDGVIEKVFKIVPPTSRYAVEIGGGDGSSCSNIRNLLVNHGWSGLFLEGDPELSEKCRELYKDTPRVKSVQAWVYPGNVEVLLEENGVPKDLDFLSIDIDSNDWYVWRVMWEYRPKLVVIEYNPSFPPPARAVVDFHPLNYWDGSDYYGASIQSLYELGKRKGYELIFAERSGNNLFFVDGKYFGRFGIADNSPAKLYHPPAFHGLFEGRLAPSAGRIGGRGHPAWDTFEADKDGRRVRPFAGDLVCEKVVIRKRFVER